MPFAMKRNRFRPLGMDFDRKCITQIDLVGVRDYEIAIEVSEEDLRRYGISFDQVVSAVRAGSIDLPGGQIKTDQGEILIRAKGQLYTGREFEKIKNNYLIPTNQNSQGTFSNK